MNAGPARIAAATATLDYCRELGVPIEVFTNENADALLLQRDVRGALTARRSATATAKADVYGYVSELLAKATDQGALDADLTADDKERADRVPAQLRRARRPGHRRAYTGGGRRGYDDDPGAGTRGRHAAAAVRAVATCSPAGSGNYFSFELGWDQAMLMFQPVGGMDRIPYALARRSARGRDPLRRRGRPRSPTPPTASRSATDRRGRARRVAEADFCVGTIPPQVLEGSRATSAAEVNAGLAYAVAVATGKIGLEYGRRWWEEDERIYGGITNTNIGPGTIWYPSSGYLGERGTVVGYYNFGANADAYSALRHARAADARRCRRARRSTATCTATSCARSFSVAWQTTRYSEGGWVSWPVAHGSRAATRGCSQPGRQRLLRRRPPQPRDRLAARRVRVRPQGRHPAPRAGDGGEDMTRMRRRSRRVSRWSSRGRDGRRAGSARWDSRDPPRQGCRRQARQASVNMPPEQAQPVHRQRRRVGEDVALY